MKTLKFAGLLPELILNREKYTTWRPFDDKNLEVADKISFLRQIDKSEFAQAEIISVKETTFGNLDEDDWDGHEKFSSEEEMYETYSKYMKTNITPETKLKVVKFKLI